MKRANRTTKDQKNFLVEYLEKHQEFAAEKDDSIALSAQWNKLGSILNSFGGASKNGDDWKKAWSFMKSKAKVKLQQSFDENYLTDLDQRIISIASLMPRIGLYNTDQLKFACADLSNLQHSTDEEDVVSVPTPINFQPDSDNGESEEVPISMLSSPQNIINIKLQPGSDNVEEEEEVHILSTQPSPTQASAVEPKSTHTPLMRPKSKKRTFIRNRTYFMQIEAKKLNEMVRQNDIAERHAAARNTIEQQKVKAIKELAVAFKEIAAALKGFDAAAHSK